MRDPSWNTYTPTPSGRFPGWAKALAGLAVFITILAVALATYQVGARHQAWPLARMIAARLATEEGTCDLYRNNPGLSDLYPTEGAFLEAVAPLRAGLELPEQEPLQDRRGFSSQVGPLQARLRARGTGGTWMDLVVRRQGPFGSAPRGEGISSLVLAESREGLNTQYRHLREAGSERHWQRFRDTAKALASGTGARACLEQKGLAHSPVDPAAFLALCEARQASLTALPASRADAKARLTLHSSLLGRDALVACPLPGGGSLRLAWRNDQLSEARLD
jgi:hypothetical protein